MAMGILPWHVRVCVHALTLPDKLFCDAKSSVVSLPTCLSQATGSRTPSTLSGRCVSQQTSWARRGCLPPPRQEMAWWSMMPVMHLTAFSAV